jgi:hypothetical protein
MIGQHDLVPNFLLIIHKSLFYSIEEMKWSRIFTYVKQYL